MRLKRFDRCKFSSPAGYTLIEVLVAFALLALILGALYSTFFLSHKAVSGRDEHMLKLQEARGALDMIEREIDSSFFRDRDKNTIFKIDDRDVFGKQASAITFTAFSPQRPGVSVVRYLIKEADSRLILYKEVSLPFGEKKISEEAEIIEGIEEFVIEARQGNTWLRTWDSSLMHRLPDEVKVSMKFRAKEKEIVLFTKAKPVIT